MPENIAKLEEKIGYTFADKSLLEQALTHSSTDSGTSYERLEFLGDRVLGFIMSEILFKKFDNHNEGLLSRRHAALVRQETLAHIAKDLSLGDYLALGRGEEASGGRKKPSILSDAVEAIVAAIYLDSNLDKVRTFIQSQWEQYIENVEIKDAKSHLQEWLQSKGDPLPEYHVLESQGEAHSRTFVVQVQTQSFGSATGQGSSKQAAQQKAAMKLLKQAGVRP